MFSNKTEESITSSLLQDSKLCRKESGMGIYIGPQFKLHKLTIHTEINSLNHGNDK